MDIQILRLCDVVVHIFCAFNTGFFETRKMEHNLM